MDDRQTTRPRVVIVDRCPHVRFLLATQLELDDRFEVVAEAGSATDAITSVGTTAPDLVLVDLARRSCSLIRDLRRRGSTACIVALSSATRPEQAAALDAGADGVQPQSSMTSTLVADLADLLSRHDPHAHLASAAVSTDRRPARRRRRAARGLGPARLGAGLGPAWS